MAALNYEKLQEMASKKPNKNSPSLNKLLKKKTEKLTDEEIKLVHRTMQDFEVSIYSRTSDSEVNSKKIKLGIFNRPDIKMRREHQTLGDYMRSKYFITSCIQDVPELHNHLYVADTPDDYEIDDKFIAGKTQFTSWKMQQMKATETEAGADAYSNYELIRSELEFCFSQNSYKSCGIKPLETPFQM